VKLGLEKTRCWRPSSLFVLRGRQQWRSEGGLDNSSSSLVLKIERFAVDYIHDGRWAQQLW